MLIATSLAFAIALPVPATGQEPAGGTVQMMQPVLPPPVDIGMVERQNFHLLTVLDTPAYRERLAVSKPWQAASSARHGRIARAVAACGRVGQCRLQAFRWTAAEVSAYGTALSETLRQTARMSPLAATLRASGDYARYATFTDEKLIGQAWADTAVAHNNIIDIYGLGRSPRYPVIDSINFDAASELWRKLVVEATNQIMASSRTAASSLRDDPGHRLALTLLYLNERENAGFFPDLDSNWNAAARVRVARTNWSAYPNTVILVLGDGPDRPGQTIGSFGKLRLDHAVRLYRTGVAPFIIVSGGNVHPASTPFNEAVEMRRELVTRHAIPVDAIIIEPHARHTTTNFRNAARLMIRYGIPLDRPAIATTSEGHSVYASGAEFDRKAMDEIGMVPRRVLKRLSPYDFTFLPDPVSTHRDARDPLDP